MAVEILALKLMQCREKFRLLQDPFAVSLDSLFSGGDNVNRRRPFGYMREGVPPLRIPESGIPADIRRSGRDRSPHLEDSRGGIFP
jgi:hypothetical protein